MNCHSNICVQIDGANGSLLVALVCIVQHMNSGANGSFLVLFVGHLCVRNNDISVYTDFHVSSLVSVIGTGSVQYKY